MNRKTRLSIALALTAAGLLTAVLAWLSRDAVLAVLRPDGPVASQQLDLIVFTCLLAVIVVLPVFFLTIYIPWKYRATNKKAAYKPDLHGSALAEAIWWLVPLVLIVILAVVTWVSSHRLDPYRPLKSDATPVRVQVAALNWKWLFIYPEENIATVNYLQVPEDTPINFEITADAPMNSFWIPKLGGQVYAMAGMQTKLHLQADRPGEYRGVSANLSGEGFAGMTFTLKATSDAAYREWLAWVKQVPEKLTTAQYDKLAMPSKDHPVTVYASRDPGLYDRIIMKYMMPGHGASPEGKRHDGAHNEANTHHDAGHDGP